MINIFMENNTEVVSVINNTFKKMPIDFKRE